MVHYPFFSNLTCVLLQMALWERVFHLIFSTQCFQYLSKNTAPIRLNRIVSALFPTSISQTLFYLQHFLSNNFPKFFSTKVFSTNSVPTKFSQRKFLILLLDNSQHFSQHHCLKFFNSSQHFSTHFVENCGGPDLFSILGPEWQVAGDLRSVLFNNSMHSRSDELPQPP